MKYVSYQESRRQFKSFGARTPSPTRNVPALPAIFPNCFHTSIKKTWPLLKKNQKKNMLKKLSAWEKKTVAVFISINLIPKLSHSCL